MDLKQLDGKSKVNQEGVLQEDPAPREQRDKAAKHQAGRLSKEGRSLHCVGVRLQEEETAGAHRVPILGLAAGVAAPTHDETSKMGLNQGFKTLVLDLDETLVHSSTQPMQKFDLQVKVFTGGQGESINVYVRIRPYAKEFLRFASKYFEVVIFTASTREVIEFDTVRRANPRRARHE